MLRVSDLRFAYGDGGFELRVPEFHAAAGEKIALIGPSGSGKTTLLHLLAGIRVPAAGEVRWGDLSISQAGAASRRRYRLTQVGLVFQEFELLEYLTVLENILIGCRLSRALRLTGERRTRAARLAAEVGLSDKLRRLPDALSQGERQRVAICRALLHEPAVVLADEPTGNLDPTNKLRILELLIADAQRRGTVFIAATHDHQLLGHFDRVIDVLAWAGDPPQDRSQHDAPTGGSGDGA